MSSLFKRYLDQQIDKAIYVWGAQGDVLSALHDPEKWIKNQESDLTNRKRAIDLYRARSTRRLLCRAALGRAGRRYR